MAVHIGRLRALVIVLSLLAGTLVALATAPIASRADATDGNTLRRITAAVPPCPIGTGLAFDGDELILSCWSTNSLYYVDPSDGALLRTVPVTGITGIGALAYDRARDAVWACEYATEDVMLIESGPTSATATRAFTPTGGCIDGLAFDGTDQTLFTSGDVAGTVWHYTTDGQRIDSRDVRNSLGGCGSSGIAVGGSELFLANNGCQQIFRAAKRDNATPRLFAGFPERIEDLECDDVTFRAGGKAAIWSKDAYDSILNAFELGVGDCGFGGLPPSGGGDEQFVYVAFGDSYQSGEGVGNSISRTDDYLRLAYENGSNHPAAVGGQQNTYTDAAVDGGNSCHRSLANYAKINADRLEPGAQVVLVDVTCSGAKIVKDGKPGVVGRTGSGTFDPDSQVAQALERLAAVGLSADDVDLVSVGMGGNDARFGEIVQACLLPNLARRLLKAYPNAPGEIEFIANQFATCERVDNHLFHTDEAIQALAAKQTAAQDVLLDVFDSARILQLTYPDSLPAERDAPSWCGGIRKEDLAFAKGKIDQIDDVVRETVEDQGRLEIVDIQSAFGGNALCPGSAELTLANGFSEENFTQELTRLLNLDGDGDARARAKLDTLVDRYHEWKACWREHLSLFGPDCDVDAAYERMLEAGRDVLAYLQTQMNLIQANVIAPSEPGGESIGVRGDRSRGLFHPNANGFAVMACHVRAVYGGTSGSGCLSSTSPIGDTINGYPVENAPYSIFDPDLLFSIGGFGPYEPIKITLYSQPMELGTVTADENGIVRTTVRLPDVAAGVHTLEFQGESETGAAVHKRARVDVAGRPSGAGSWGAYLCCFDPRSGPEVAPEQVEISYLGRVVDTVTTDEDGGVFVQLPLLDLLSHAGPIEVSARSIRTSATVVTSVNPVPTVPGLWATGDGSDALQIRGRGTTVEGRAHSDGGIVVSGSGHVLTGGSEYVSTLAVQGGGHQTPGATQVAAGDAPAVASLADYRPGGSRAVGASYSAIPASSCRGGTWTVRAQDVPAGVVYVPCGVDVTGTGGVRATLAAEGPIRISGSGVTVSPGVTGAPSLITASDEASAVAVVGRSASLVGTVVAPAGGVQLSGDDGSYRCGVLARTIDLSGSDISVPVRSDCRAT